MNVNGSFRILIYHVSLVLMLCTRSNMSDSIHIENLPMILLQALQLLLQHCSLPLPEL